MDIRVSLFSQVQTQRSAQPLEHKLGQYYEILMKIGHLATCLTLPVTQNSFSATSVLENLRSHFSSPSTRVEFYPMVSDN